MKRSRWYRFKNWSTQFGMGMFFFWYGIGGTLLVGLAMWMLLTSDYL